MDIVKTKREYHSFEVTEETIAEACALGVVNDPPGSALGKRIVIDPLMDNQIVAILDPVDYAKEFEAEPLPESGPAEPIAEPEPGEGVTP